MNLFLQLLGNGLVQGAMALCLAAGFGFVYRSLRIFHIAMGGQFVFSCYAFYFFAVRLNWGFFWSGLTALVLSAAFGVLIELAVYRPFFKKNSSSGVMMIASLGQTEPADLVALVEVEGDTALTDLTMRTRLRTLHYNYIVTHGSDPRGINVALLWQEGAFRPLHTHTLCWQQRLGVEAPTRDVLHVQGLARSGDTLDVIVCHMPSQYGKRHSKRLRSAIAKGLRDYTDSLLSANPRANIIILGDMNDSPQSRPMRRALGATVLDEKVREFQSYNVPKFERNALFNISLLRSDPHHPRGTYRYKGNWEMLDQCIVSGRLLDTRSHLHVATTPVRIVSHDFLLEGDKSYGGVKPWRTWQGPMFRGGFSDHLPIVVEFEYER